MDQKEIKLLMSDQTVPVDYILYDDPIYGKRIFVRQGTGYKEETKPTPEPVRIHADRAYTMNDASSFVAAVQKYGDPMSGIIFYDEIGVTMFFDEDSRTEKVSLPLTASHQLGAFFKADEDGVGVRGTFTQKEFLKLLDTYPECISNISTLRPMVEKVQLSTTIDFEANLDPNELTFIYQEKSGGNQTGKLPKKLMLTLPYFEGSMNTVTIAVDLEITKPYSDTEKPIFTLTNINYQRILREALVMEIVELQKLLPEDWIFVHGTF